MNETVWNVLKRRLPAFLGILGVLVIGIAGFQSVSGAVPTSLNVLTNEVVILDAGHGGMDGGAVGVDGIVEKDINLAIATKVRDLLVMNGVDVVMTREEDTLIYNEGVEGVRNQKVSDLHNRLQIIEEYPSAIFVSIHQNQFQASICYGAQVFHGAKSEQSKILAEITQKRFQEMLQPENTRQYKQSGSEIYLLDNAEIPAIMVECGFLSNAAEAHKLADDEYQNQVAFVIFSAIMEYYYFGI